jgi:hypothetical protein
MGKDNDNGVDPNYTNPLPVIVPGMIVAIVGVNKTLTISLTVETDDAGALRSRLHDLLHEQITVTLTPSKES